MSEDPRTRPTDKDVLIAVMGLTGSGKSTLINLACQSERKLPVGHGIQSLTDSVDAAPPFELDGRRVLLFDTPGFDDTNKSETEVLRIIAFELEKQFRAGATLHGIIYVHRISDIRVGGLAKTNFGIFRKLCGDNSLKNVIIVTNMWSKVTEEEGMQRAAELASLDDFFKPALEKKARLMHHTRDTVESIHEIVRAIMENHPVPLIIQEELVNEGKDIKQTEAGQEVEKRILELMAEFERKIKEGQAAAEEARKQRDEEAMQEILEERAKNDEKLAKVREENAKHAERYKELQARLIAHEARAAADKAALEAQLAARLQAQHISVPQQANHQPQARHRPATYYTITSGKQHTIWNEAHQFYATIDRDEKYVIAKDYSFTHRDRQQWIFNKVGGYWTIKSTSSGLYLSLTSQGTLKARTTAAKWDLHIIIHETDRFRIHAVDWETYVIRLDGGHKGERLDIYERGRRGEVWVIEEEP